MVGFLDLSEIISCQVFAIDSAKDRRERELAKLIETNRELIELLDKRRIRV